MQDALRFVESCIDRYAEQAWRAAYVMLSNAADADDLLQQAFLVAWRKADTAPRDNTWPWLATIIANEARNFRRKRARRQGVSLHSIGEPAMRNDPDKRLQQAELSALVHVSLAELSDDQRIAIVLTHLSGLSQSQAAEAIGVPLNTLKARARRGLDSLRDALGKRAPGLEGTLKNLQVGAPPGGFIAAKAAWTASLSANVAAAGTATVASAAGVKAVLATAAATLVLSVGVVAAIALQPDKPAPNQQLAAAINHAPIAPRNDSPEHEPKPKQQPEAGSNTPESKTPEAMDPPPPVSDNDEKPTPAAVREADNEAVIQEQPLVGEQSDGLKLAYEVYERLLPLVLDERTPSASAEVRKELAKFKSPWSVAGALEAVRQGEIERQGAGKRFLPDVLILLDRKQAKLQEHEVVVVNAMDCLRALYSGQVDDRLAIAERVLEWHRTNRKRMTWNQADHASRLLQELAGANDVVLSDSTENYWWEWLHMQKYGNQDDAEKMLKYSKKDSLDYRPQAFGQRVSGSHVVFAIDVSDSMKHPISEKDLPKIRKLANNLDWSSMPDRPCPLDLVKAELCFSLDQLVQGRDAGSPEGSHPKSRNDEKYWFIIVTYSKNAESITKGWVEATEKNCERWKKKVADLLPQDTTNVQDALLQSFGAADKRTPETPLHLDVECTLSGADTIVFLTDGFPTWSNDSEDASAKDEFGNPVGNGEYVKRDKLLELVAHLNRFRKVVINTAGIGIHDKKLMKGLAEISGGAYTDWSCGIDWK